jgi:hypothetical protein
MGPLKTSGARNGRSSYFLGADQHPFGLRRAVKAGFGNQLGVFETGLLNHCQEILPRYRPALSLGPALDDLLLIFRQFSD